MLFTEPYALTFLHHTRIHLSKHDLSEILASAWTASENPNQDPNVSKRALLSMFRSADPGVLMTMNEQTKEQLRAVLEDEEKAAFAQKILETIDTDDESYEDIGNSVIHALLKNDAEGLLIALCGWSAESLLNLMETDLPYREEPV